MIPDSFHFRRWERGGAPTASLPRFHFSDHPIHDGDYDDNNNKQSILTWVIILVKILLAVSNADWYTFTLLFVCNVIRALVNILLLVLELFNKEEWGRVVVVAVTSDANDADSPPLLVLSWAAAVLVVVNAVDSCSIIGLPTTWTTDPFTRPYSTNTFCWVEEERRNDLSSIYQSQSYHSRIKNWVHNKKVV